LVAKLMVRIMAKKPVAFSVTMTEFIVGVKTNANEHGQEDGGLQSDDEGV
jgi:hypothetical protein